MSSSFLSPQKKASLINEKNQVYGSFAEIGGGQETVSFFFKAGHSSNTVAKSISAYDMSVSNAIYGKSPRYVSSQRMKQILDHEYRLLKKRVKNNKCFFAFGNTVSIAKRDSKEESQAWMGIRFQTKKSSQSSDILVHFKTKDTMRRQQQEAIGILGVNLIYACFYARNSEEAFIDSLMNDLNRQRIEIDYIDIKSSEKILQKEKINLLLVQKKITGSCLFLKNQKIALLSESYFQKKFLIQRISQFKKPQLQAFKDSLSYLKNKKSFKENPVCLFEVSIAETKKINFKKTLSEIKKIQIKNHPVLISNFSFDYELKDFIRKISFNHIVFLIEQKDLKKLFSSFYYKKYKANILKAFGKLFDNKVKMLVYSENKSAKSLQLFKTEKSLEGLFNFLKKNKYLEQSS